MSISDSEIRIDAGDGVGIYGTLREIEGAPLVILCHGFTCWRNDTLLYVAALELEKHGFSTFRFDFYFGEADARDLVDCTVDVHARDVDTVVRHFRALDADRPLVAVGHSLGGMSIVAADANRLDAVILLDPTHGAVRGRDKSKEQIVAGEYRDTWTQWEPRLHAYLAGDAVKSLASPEMIASWLRDSDAEIARLTKPLLIFTAGRGVLRDTGDSYLQHASSAVKAQRVIDSDHNFCANNPMVAMFDDAATWLRTVLP